MNFRKIQLFNNRVDVRLQLLLAQNITMIRSALYDTIESPGDKLQLHFTSTDGEDIVFYIESLDNGSSRIIVNGTGYVDSILDEDGDLPVTLTMRLTYWRDEDKGIMFTVGWYDDESKTVQVNPRTVVYPANL